MRALIFVLASLVVASPAPANEELVFIVHADNPTKQISADELADYFLKKRGQWPNGTPVRFIDRKAGTAERKQFLDSFVGKSPRDIELYWIGQKLYSGDSAPIQVGSDAMTISVVSSFKGAIGYVRGDLAGVKGVKKLEVTGRQ